MKYQTVNCLGYYENDKPQHVYDVTIALGSWDGVEDSEDESIFFYMDGEPLEIGTVLDDGFIIQEIDQGK
jgi:hypothetical protein